MKQKGFTLVELIVVLAILAVLSAIMVPSLTGYIDKAKNTQLLSIARSVYTAAQIEVSEAYARGPIEVRSAKNETNKPAVGNFPSIRNIVENSEMKDWGFAGQDYVDYRGTVKYFVNGFGFQNNNNAKYHFKVLVSKDGKIEQLSVCSGDKIATLKDDEFEVTASKCKDGHKNSTLFNYIFINYDTNHEERYSDIFYGTIR
ncbi:MAG: type II secretion system GspH family protein [Solobacterium sp.]|nr:type II secretion system GspH family protein [Solobacterium sp.]